MIDLRLVEFREDAPQKPPIRKAHLRSSHLGGTFLMMRNCQTWMRRKWRPKNWAFKQWEKRPLQAVTSDDKGVSPVIMGKVKFNNPKDPEMLARVIDYVTNSDPKAVVLDPFGGSGTTGQAVLALNKSNQGERRFIVIENDSDDYIEELTSERLATASIRGVPKAKDDALLKKGLRRHVYFFWRWGTRCSWSSVVKRQESAAVRRLWRGTFSTRPRVKISTRRSQTGKPGSSAQARGMTSICYTSRIWIILRKRR